MKDPIGGLYENPVTDYYMIYEYGQVMSLIDFSLNY